MFADYSILENAIDLHVHIGPDYVPRFSDSIDLAREATAAGMRAIVVKSHLSPTMASAYAANKVVGGTQIFGGIALNEPNGEYNPRNVVASLRTGAKIVWLSTVDARYALDKAQSGHWIEHYVHGSEFGYTRKGLQITNERQEIKEEVQEILRLCKEYDVILASGHVSPEETLILAKEAKKISFKKLEVTHPNIWYEDYPLELLRELASYDATFTLAFGACSPHNGRQDPKEIVEIIKGVGAKHCCLITDYGQTVHPSPVEGYRVYCQLLLNLGVSREEIDLMAKTNPARLLSLD